MNNELVNKERGKVTMKNVYFYAMKKNCLKLLEVLDLYFCAPIIERFSHADKYSF